MLSLDKFHWRLTTLIDSAWFKACWPYSSYSFCEMDLISVWNLSLSQTVGHFPKSVPCLTRNYALTDAESNPNKVVSQTYTPRWRCWETFKLNVMNSDSEGFLKVKATYSTAAASLRLKETCGNFPHFTLKLCELYSLINYLMKTRACLHLQGLFINGVKVELQVGTSAITPGTLS